MKAKSKVLLGLLVALAMMVMAVPAFAQELTFTVSDPTPASVTGYIGDEKATFTFDITETDAKTGDSYAVELSDSVTGTGMATTKFPQGSLEASAVKLDASGKATVTVTIKQAGLANNYKGKHNVSYVVKKTSEGTTYTADAKTCQVTVADMPTATLSGANAGVVATKNVGDSFGLKVTGVTGGDDVSYKWEISKTTTKPANPEDVTDTTNWEDIADNNASSLTKTASLDMDGKFIRCVVTVDGKAIVANDGATNANYCAKVSVNDQTTITVKLMNGDNTSTTEAKDRTFFVGEKSNDAVKLTAKVTGGTGATNTYAWYRDGEKIDGEENETLTVKAANTAFAETDAGTYKCVVTQGTLTGTSNEITITVKDTPTLAIAEATGSASDAVYEWVDNSGKFDQKAGTGVGNVLIAKADLAKALTLTADIDGDVEAIEWYKGNDEDKSARGKETYTIPANTLDQDDAVVAYSALVYFKDIEEPLEFTATIVTTDGQLEGKTLVSTDGGVTITTNPTYTIALPLGESFREAAEQAETIGALTEAGVTVEPANTSFASAAITVTVTAGDATTPAKLTFKHKDDKIADAALASPVVAPMEVTVTTKENNTVVLPVDETVGYQITLPTQGWTLNAGNLDTEKQLDLDKATSGVVTKSYTGEAVEATVKPANGVGEISNVRYLDWTGKNTNPTQADVAKATTTAPSNVGTYLVYCDAADGEQYGAAKNLVAGKIVITQLATADQVKAAADKLFVIDPESVEYNGEEQKTTVEFADGVESAGAIDKVTYKDENNNPVTPKAVGKYKVLVTTKSETTDDSDVKNVAEMTNPVEIGTFEITKVAPT